MSFMNNPAPTRFRLRAVAAGLGVLAGSFAAAAPPIEAVAEARHDLALGFSVRGRVAQVLVEPGARVKKGDPLVRLDDREGEAQVKLYALRAASGLEVEAAEAALKLAENEEKRVAEALRQAGANEFELERAKLETKSKSLSLDLARQRREEAALLLEQARAQHERYSLLAPMDGVVEEVSTGPGEMVDETKPILRLVMTEVLQVDAAAPMALAAGKRVGDPAWVTFRADPAARPAPGRIIQIAGVADAGSERRRIRVEVPNALAQPAGSHVLVMFEPPDSAPGAGVSGGADATERGPATDRTP